MQGGGLRSAMLETLHHTRADTTGLQSRLIRFRQAPGRIARGMIIGTIVPTGGGRQTAPRSLAYCLFCSATTPRMNPRFFRMSSSITFDGLSVSSCAHSLKPMSASAATTALNSIVPCPR